MEVVMRFQKLALVFGVAVLLASCGDTSGPVTTCGAGTQNVDGECRTLVNCGEGTTNVDNVCVPSTGTTCGEGTEAVDGVCVPSESACAEGTHLDPATGACVPDSEVVCGAGTVLGADGVCVPDNPINCGPGTVLVDGECVCGDPGPCGDFGQACCPGVPACISVSICCPSPDYPTTGVCLDFCD